MALRYSSLLGISLLLSLFAAGSCATTKNTPTEVAKTTLSVLINCAADGLAEKTTELIPAVQEIVRDGKSNYQEMLEGLKGAGEEALACAVREAWKTFTAHAAMADTDRHAQPSADRARAYLEVKDWQFVDSDSDKPEVVQDPRK